MGAAIGLPTLVASQEKEKRREYQIHGDDEKNGYDDGRGSRAADLFGAGPGRKTFLTADGRDGHTKHETLY